MLEYDYVIRNILEILRIYILIDCDKMMLHNCVVSKFLNDLSYKRLYTPNLL